MQGFIIESEDPIILEAIIKYYEAQGFVLYDRFTRRKSLIGYKIYYADMHPTKIYYEKAIEEAIKTENYELAQELTNTMNKYF